MIAMVSLAIGSTALPFILYYWLMERMSATNLSMSAYPVPIVAAFLGVVILDEQFTWNMSVG